MSERLLWIALSAIPGLGPARFRLLLESYVDAASALEEQPEALAERLQLPEEAVRLLAEVPDRLDSIEEELSSLDEQGIGFFIWTEEGYPAKLLTTTSPPPVLWWAGDTRLAHSSPTVAIVGSREASEEGLAEAHRLASVLAGEGLPVISGLAAGIDAAAHEGALACEGPTIGVCGCGLATALTRGRDGLASRVVNTGALCSELQPTAPLTGPTLFARDRIIAGLADATIVVAARAEGGAVHTAKSALKEGRRVLVVDWPTAQQPDGNRQLLRMGAIPLALGDDPDSILRAAAPQS